MACGQGLLGSFVFWNGFAWQCQGKRSQRVPWEQQGERGTAKSEEENERLEARGGIEPPIMVLQTIALPLGDRATGQRAFSYQSSVLRLRKGGSNPIA